VHSPHNVHRSVQNDMDIGQGDGLVSTLALAEELGLFPRTLGVVMYGFTGPSSRAVLTGRRSAFVGVFYYFRQTPSHRPTQLRWRRRVFARRIGSRPFLIIGRHQLSNDPTWLVYCSITMGLFESGKPSRRASHRRENLSDRKSAEAAGRRGTALPVCKSSPVLEPMTRCKYHYMDVLNIV